MELKITQVQKLLYNYVKKEKPFFIHGAPGIGKSESVRQVAQKIAEEKGKKFNEGQPNKEAYNLIDVRVSQLDPSDLRGIPFPEGKQTKWLTPSWLPTEGQGIIFFDEMNLAPPSIQSSAYQLILDRRLGDYILPDGWTIIAAGNRAIDKANVFPMAAPLKNRFSHATLVCPSEEDWREWAVENGISSDMIAFIAFKPQFLYKFDKGSKDNAFPTPRTVALASYMTNHLSGKTKDELDEIFITVASCVGEAFALEYQGFVKLKKQISIEDIIKHPEKVQDLKDVGLKYSLISGLAEKYRGDRKRLNDILGVIDYMDKEFAVFLLKLIKAMDPKHFVADIVKCKNWPNISKEYAKYFF